MPTFSSTSSQFIVTLPNLNYGAKSGVPAGNQVFQQKIRWMNPKKQAIAPILIRILCLSISRQREALKSSLTTSVKVPLF